MQDFSLLTVHILSVNKINNSTSDFRKRKLLFYANSFVYIVIHPVSARVGLSELVKFLILFVSETIAKKLYFCKTYLVAIRFKLHQENLLNSIKRKYIRKTH